MPDSQKRKLRFREKNPKSHNNYEEAEAVLELSLSARPRLPTLVRKP